MENNKKIIEKNKKYELICEKVLLLHRKRNNCDCGCLVTNLIGGECLWTRVSFDCGEMIKVNTKCLKIM